MLKLRALFITLRIYKKYIFLSFKQINALSLTLFNKVFFFFDQQKLWRKSAEQKPRPSFAVKQS